MAAPTEGGFKMSLGSLKAKSRFKASPLQKDVKRPRLALDDDEPDEPNKQQEIIGWDVAEGGALDANEKKEEQGPQIIPALPNRDWRSEARQKQLAKAPRQQAQESNNVKAAEEPKIQYGLTIVKKDVFQERESTETVTTETVETEKDDLTEEQRLEEKALDALLSGKSADNGLVIPVQAEEDAFLDDIHNAPDAPALEAYEATPIEGFGAAMLRGMGWKDDNATGSNGAAVKSQATKRRPALLGIGAKEEAATGVELGEWGGKVKGKKVVQNYNPVTLRNKRTGELISEEELKAKLENQEMVQEEEPEKRRRRHDDEKKESDGRGEKRRGKRDERGGDRDRRGDERYDNDRRQDKRTNRDGEYYESERRRDRHRDRSRDYNYGSERRKDKRRERSRSPASKKVRDRDRYRSRSRDSKRRRERRDASEDSDDRRKRRRERDYERDDHRSDRKREPKDDKYYKR